MKEEREKIRMSHWTRVGLIIHLHQDHQFLRSQLSAIERQSDLSGKAEQTKFTVYCHHFFKFP